MAQQSQTNALIETGRRNLLSSPIPVLTKQGGQSREPVNYKGITLQGNLTYFAEPNDSVTLVQQAGIVPTVEKVAPKHQLVKGVLNIVGEKVSEVSLFYSNREERFTFPTQVLAASGASYAGALFAISLFQDNENYTGYEIIHLADEEQKARPAGAERDFSFLDGIDGGPALTKRSHKNKPFPKKRL